MIERTSGQPIFLVPGAALQERIRCSCWSEVHRLQNMVFLVWFFHFFQFWILLRMIFASLRWPMFLQAAGFQALAALLPVPAYGISWPSTLPRDRHRNTEQTPCKLRWYSYCSYTWNTVSLRITMYHCTIHCITLLLCILFEGFLERMHYFRYFSRLYWFLGSNLSFPLSESHGPFRCWATAILSLCRFGLPGCFCGFGGPGLCRTNLMESQRSQPRDPTSIQVLAHQTESWNCRYEIWRLECRSSCCSRSREVETYPTLGRFGSCCILVLWP